MLVHRKRKKRYNKVKHLILIELLNMTGVIRSQYS